ncbi:MAG TPA: caspase family protein [Ktedonobacteraceae bacterium]
MPTEPQASASPSSSGRRFALVVGVNGPPALGRAPLRFAVDDGQAIAAVLQQPPCEFALFQPPLLGEQATTSQVREAVLDLAEALQEDDVALFFFSGHAEALVTEASLDDVYAEYSAIPTPISRSAGSVECFLNTRKPGTSYSSSIVVTQACSVKVLLTGILTNFISDCVSTLPSQQRSIPRVQERYVSH